MKTIPAAKFNKRMTKAIEEVDELKHSTPQAKAEMKNLLRDIYSDLMKKDEIEIYGFMR